MRARKFLILSLSLAVSQKFISSGWIKNPTNTAAAEEPENLRGQMKQFN